jgi:hypothetical protein
MILPLLLLALNPGPASSSPVKSVPLWKAWYLVSKDGKALSAFEETAEKRPRDAQIVITQKWIERVNGQKSEAYIGAVAEENRLAPVALFVERTGKARSYKTDGRVKAGRLDLTFKPANGPKPKSTASTRLAAGTYFSNFVPMAVARHFSEKGAFQFTAIVEDDGEMNVEVKSGIVEIQSIEKIIGGESCWGALIRIDGSLQEWWITKQGKTCQVNFPDSNTRLELSTEAAAKKAMAGP